MHPHHSGEGKFVHKDRGQREPRHSAFWSGKRKKFTLANLMAIGMLQVLFLANLSNFYGSAFHTNVNVHHFKILFIDYDGGIVSQAVRAAYQRLRGNGFPTLEFGDAANFPSEQSLMNEVCQNRHIYAVLYTHAGASDRLSAATGGGEAADTYNASDAISYIWNGVRYNTFGQASVAANLQRLITTSGVAYASLNGTYAYQSINSSSPQAVTALAQPFTPSAIDIMPTPQGTRVFLNTVTVVMTIISQFFYVMAMNGIAHSFEMLSRLSVTRNMYIRWTSALLYSAGLAATLTGVIWSFRENWPVTSSQGAETWLMFTFICYIHFLIIDFAAGFISVQYLPFFILTWVLLNVTSTVVPLELTPGFYKWQYALPSFEAYQLLITIWSHGCVPQLFRALPILFAWWLVGLVGSWISMIQKCNAATHIEQQMEDSSDQETIVDNGATEKDTNKIEPEDSEETPASADTDTDTAVPATAPTNGLKKKRTLDRAMDSFTSRDVNLDSLWLSTPLPFQDRLGLVPVRTAPASAAMASARRRPGMNPRLSSRPKLDA